jgi:DNA helicase-2/ATP-dependent DNA helicase PcrA
MNTLTLAVAGSRKTQSIVDACAQVGLAARTLVLTYTTANQNELIGRLAKASAVPGAVDVNGWFAFLLTHWVRPYLPLVYPDRRVRGFSFDGPDNPYAVREHRHFTSNGSVYRKNLAKLAFDVHGHSNGAAIDRLSRVYKTIYIDETQDLCGWDLEILQILMDSPIDLVMVGDVRQALLVTNERETKHKKYKYSRILDWFRDQKVRDRLEIDYQSTTWRYNAQIAMFADQIFDSLWGFAPTETKMTSVTDHDGVFAIEQNQVSAYVRRYGPTCLRVSKSSWKHLDGEFSNFGTVKGLTFDRVLVCASGPIEDFLTKGKPMKDAACCGFYVAVTRARYSVAIVMQSPSKSALPQWAGSPSTP